jgi:hypothetical protein
VCQVLALTRHQELLEAPDIGSTPELDEKIKLRAPYVVPLNILQVGESKGGCCCLQGGAMFLLCIGAFVWLACCCMAKSNYSNNVLCRSPICRWVC